MCLSVNENERLCNYEARLHAVFLFFPNVMRNMHTPPLKPLNYVLDDFPPSPAACPILGQQHCSERGGRDRREEEKGGTTTGKN